MSGPSPGEIWVMCENCGARLWSEDGYTSVRGIPCPYKRDQKGRCRTREEAPELYVEARK